MACFFSGLVTAKLERSFSRSRLLQAGHSGVSCGRTTASNAWRHFLHWKS
jgi:hypothetical protein